MARQYRTTVIPARPCKAGDKAKVEVGVQVVQRWILARLRHRRFFSSWVNDGFCYEWAPEPMPHSAP
jgi:hypothetical protein